MVHYKKSEEIQNLLLIQDEGVESSSLVQGVEIPETAHQMSTGGVVGLLLSTAISLYASTPIAKLHEFGGKRHIRYRDLAGFIYGRKAYYLTWLLQYVNLFMINTGFLILAGQALKAIYQLFRDDNVMKLPYFIAIAGFACGLFAICIPHLSALRIWLGFSTVCSLIFIITVFTMSLRDGIRTPPRDYSIPRSDISKVFTTIGACATLIFLFNTGMIPEIQATVRQPVAQNMINAIYFQFTVGVLPFYAVIFMGYWAYGNDASAYLLNNANGPVWAKTFANISAFLQIIIVFHIAASPMYEYLDTKYGIKAGALPLKKLSFRIMMRGGYVAVSTLLAATLPFLGDFTSLTGAISSLPLSFILANHMYLVAKRNQLTSLQKTWHWLNVFFLSIAAAVAALRLIVVDFKNYSIFADM